MAPHDKSTPASLIFKSWVFVGLLILIRFEIGVWEFPINELAKKTSTNVKFFMRVGWLEELIIWFENNGYFFNKDLFFYWFLDSYAFYGFTIIVLMQIRTYGSDLIFLQPK